MLNLRNTNIVFGLLALLLIGYDISKGISAWIYLLFLFIYSLILFWGSYEVSSGFYMPVVCKSDTTEKIIAISFDDGPLPAYTPRVLEILKEQKVPAAFFCIGKHIQLHPQLALQIIADGHIIGNHSFSHDKWFDLFSSKKMRADLATMDSGLAAIVGKKPRLFRPPYGVTNPNLHKAVQSAGYSAIGWNIRSFDTVIKDEQKLLKKVTGLLKPGSIILFHDTAKVTPGMLPAFISIARQMGYEFVRVDKLLNLEPYV